MRVRNLMIERDESVALQFFVPYTALINIYVYIFQIDTTFSYHYVYPYNLFIPAASRVVPKRGAVSFAELTVRISLIVHIVEGLNALICEFFEK